MLAAPVVLSFNGGEETLSQAAHRYMAESEFAPRSGALIKIIFQALVASTSPFSRQVCSPWARAGVAGGSCIPCSSGA